MGNDPNRVQEIFLAAVQAVQDRAGVLDRECGDDAALRQRVEALLKAHDEPGSFLPNGAAPLAATMDSAPGEAEAQAGSSAAIASEGVGSCIGPYKLLQNLGEGGMGTVWVAEQEKPVKRRVAIKLIKAGMDSAQVVRRFEAERQALAMMDHTNIAKVLDAGTTPGGRPYFVMELVKGVPITKYCDELHLPISDRLELFVSVCQAIQHAHQKGIIHRDIKPSNVLVCMQDGRPVPKVIDFGVAKALHQKLTDRTMYTEIGAVVGTLEYMSPEQAELSALDIDTRADVYALGVLLYELLTGTTPLDKARLRNAAFSEMLRIIREEDPPKPSTRLTQSKDSLPSLAAQRRTESAKLSKLVRGELDWLVMKCLEKDRTRRYETASGLARDVERYLHDEPVEACPPSARYRLKKLLRRNKGPVVAAAAVLLVLVAGVSVSTWQAVRATRAEADARLRRDEAVAARQREADRADAEAKERRRAELAEGLARDNEQKAASERDRALDAEKEAKQQAAISRAVKQFLQDDLLRQAGTMEQADQLRALSESGFEVKENPTIRELLDRAAAGLTAERIDQKFPGQPQVQAEILCTLGHCYNSIGEGAKALAHFKRAADLQRTHSGPVHVETLTALNGLATGYLSTARSTAQIDEAIALLEKVRDARMDILGPEHSATRDSTRKLAHAYLRAGRTAESIALLEKLRDVEIAELGSNDPDTLSTLDMLASAYRSASRLAEAVALFEQVLDGRISKIGPDHPATLNTLVCLAWAYKEAGRTGEAIVAFEKLRDTCGPKHPSTSFVLSSLAVLYLDGGRTAEGIALLEKARDADMTQHGPDHPNTLTSFKNLANVYRYAGRTEDADRIIRELNERRLKNLADIPADDWKRLLERGELHARVGEWQKAARDFTAVVAAQPDDHWTRCRGAILQLQSGDLDGYRQTCRELLDRFGDTANVSVAERTAKVCLLAPDSVSDVDALVRLAELAVTGTESNQYYEWFALARAMADYRTANYEAVNERLKDLSPKWGADYWNATAKLLMTLAHHRLGHVEEARQAFQQATEIMEQPTFPRLESGDLGVSWHDWLICQIVRREAEGVIDKPHR